MKHCKSCGKKAHDDDSVFCISCGSRLAGIAKGQEEPGNGEDEEKLTDLDDMEKLDELREMEPDDDEAVFREHGGTTKETLPKLQQRQEQQLQQAGEVWKSPLGIEFVLVPAGTFTMGSRDNEDAGPPHEVTISRPFYLGKFTVAQRDWKVAMSEKPPSRFKSDTRPVDNVSWSDALAFISRLNRREKENEYRLPTEAEWEYACRAGTVTKFCFGERDYDLSSYAWFDGTAGGKTQPVGKLRPNKWGLHDMHGNLLEWCQDWHGDYPAATETDPEGPHNGPGRIVRGGCWTSHAEACASYFRSSRAPGGRFSFVGFRIVREI